MSCPFQHLWSKDCPADKPLAHEELKYDGGSAFNSARGCLRGAPQTAGDAQAAGAAAQTALPSKPTQPQEPLTCPLGFGSNRGPKLGQFHCPLCRCLYYHCVATSCGHRFCGDCIKPFRDCPACGADITSTTPDSEMQLLVERYIEAHAATHTIWDLESTSSSAGTTGATALSAAAPAVAATPASGTQPAGEERSRGAFLLQLGLRALAGGNLPSSQHRLTQAAQELESRLEEQPRQGVQAMQGSSGGDIQANDQPGVGAACEAERGLRCRLAAVYGCLGDCRRRGGDVEGALGWYERSMAQAELAGDGIEALEARAVAMSKAGEARHLTGDLAAAAQWYRSALVLRRQALAVAQQGVETAMNAHSTPGEARRTAAASGDEIAAELSLASSMIKVADAEQSLASAPAPGEGGGEDLRAAVEHASLLPHGLLQEAAELLAGVRARMDDQPVGMQRKFTTLAQFVGLGAT